MDGETKPEVEKEVQIKATIQKESKAWMSNSWPQKPIVQLKWIYCMSIALSKIQMVTLIPHGHDRGHVFA